MIVFSSNKIIKLAKNSTGIISVLLLLMISIFSTVLYNNKKEQINKNYKDVISNIYFQKSITYIFNNLTPRYKSINHKISAGETFNKILSNYLISSDEIAEIINELNSDYNLDNLKANLKIEFIIDQSSNKKITEIVFPKSRTEKIQLTRNLNTGLFKKKLL